MQKQKIIERNREKGEGGGGRGLLFILLQCRYCGLIFRSFCMADILLFSRARI